MKKAIKLSVYVALFFVGLIANSSIADAQSTNPSLTDGSKHTCYEVTTAGSTQWRVFDCNDCVQKRARVVEGTRKGECTKS